MFMKVTYAYISSLILIILFFSDSELTAQNSNTWLQTPDSLYAGLQYRNIGPFRGGRSVAGSGVIGDPLTYYMGSTGGGIWKTTDAGATWNPIADGQIKTGSVGAIAVASSNTNIIYAGMGEHAVRGVMTSHGNGVYKSVDGGINWQHLGLDNSRHISEIRVHPQNADVVFVAVQGAVHGDSQDRGVYKSTDGGQSWRKVLYVDNRTGAADLAMDESNPMILFASMWDHRRLPWQVQSGGKGSAIYKSTDGGENWEKVTNGLPSELGKTAVDISPANPQIVYANIEAEGEKAGVYRSNDGGKTWKQTTKDRITVARAWYYIEIFADPKNEDVVYVLNAPMLKSTDGGKSFKSIRNPHGDQHHMWINPENPSNIILLNDGGACITFNGGSTWSSQQNQPTIQFYRVITDNVFPYNVYGGQQDNSSIVTASRTGSPGIGWKDWFNGPGCESAFLAFDPDNPTQIYGGCYQGNIGVMDRETKEQTDIIAYPTVGLGWTPSEMKYRFNWNAPIVASPQDPNTIYHCGNQVLRTRNGGVTWEEISPDLTSNDKSKQGPGGAPYTNEGAGGEVYNTISYFEASPHSADVLWTGSDCGLIHVSTDAGENWQNVTPPGIGEALINAIDVSPHDPAKAYAAITKYKFNDFSPMIYVTENYGKTWQKRVSGIAAEDYVRVVREDEKTPGLLFAGTESGIYMSEDDGRNWKTFRLNMPHCPITDLTFRDNDLVVATSGRSFWILDNLSCLQQGGDPNDDIVLFTPKPSYRLSMGGRRDVNLGKNPAPGILIDYYVSENLPDSIDLVMTIQDGNGNTLRSYSSKPDKTFKSYSGGPSKPKILRREKGVNRFNWDMRKEQMTGVDGRFLLGGYSGPMVPPGTYTITLSAGDNVLSTEAVLLADPRINADQQEYDTQYKLISEAEEMARDLQESAASMHKTKERISTLQKLFEEEDEAKELITYGKDLSKEIADWETLVLQPKQKTFQDVINFPNKLSAECMDLMDRMGGMIPTITDGMKTRLADLKSEYQEVKSAQEKISEGFDNYNSLFRKSNLNLLKN
jgi:photosystem II stability/assembly factor-like uncharacterized protein